MKEHSGLKRFLVACIPFGIYFKSWRYFLTKKEKYKDFIVVGLNFEKICFFSSVILMLILTFYGSGVVENKSFDFTKWKEIQQAQEKQYQTERLIFEQNVAQKSFKYLAGEDGIIDYQEFEDFLEQNTKDEYQDLYSDFNQWLNLEEKWVDSRYRREKEDER